MLLLLENDHLINFTFFFSGLLLGGLISKSVYSFDNRPFIIKRLIHFI